MSLLAERHPGQGPAPDRPVVVELGESDRAELIDLLEQDPLVNAVAEARIRASRSLGHDRFAGRILGARRGGVLTAAAMDTGTLVPIGGGPAEWSALAERISVRPRACSSIVGRADAVAAIWGGLCPVWAPARAVRAVQPLLAVDRSARIPPGHRGLRRMQAGDLERYLPAAAAMFTEELGVPPGRLTEGSGYRRRIGALIGDGRAFGVIERGEVVFKADLAVVTTSTCQIQGVWVRPDRRGAGLATEAMAAVLQQALTLAPTATLYVNDFNAAARRVYARLGMQQSAVLSTVLF